MSSPNMSMRPYIGVESGAQLEPELSRLIGSAIFSEDAIVICCGGISSLFGAALSSDFGVGFRSAGLDVGRFLSSLFTGTSVIPHFGHSPGASITTSGCIGQVYFWPSEASMTPVDASSINKNSFFIWFLKAEWLERLVIGRKRMQARTPATTGRSGNRRSVREHALLQDRFSETETTGRPGIESFDFERRVHRSRNDRGHVIARADHPKHRRIRAHAFCNNGTDILAAWSFRRRLLFCGGRMHRTATALALRR